jgi:hypothetical protein
MKISRALDIIQRAKLNLFREARQKQRPIVSRTQHTQKSKRGEKTQPYIYSCFCVSRQGLDFILCNLRLNKLVCRLIFNSTDFLCRPTDRQLYAPDQTQILVSARREKISKWVSHYRVSNRAPKIMGPLHLHVCKNGAE